MRQVKTGHTRRRHLATLGALGSTPALAAACGVSGSETPAVTSQPVQLQFQFYLAATHPAGGAWRSVLHAFSQTTNGKITFNESEWEVDTSFQKVQTYIAGGTSPDAWYGGYFDLIPLMVQGAAVPVDDAMKGLGDWRKRRDDISPLMRDTISWKGKLSAVPVDRNFIAMAYSPKHLRRAGLADPKPDWKWDDLLTMAKRAASPPEIWGLDYQYAPGYGAVLFWMQFYASTGGQLLNRDATKMSLSLAEAEQTSKWLYDLIHAHQMAAFPSQGELLQNGEKTVFEQQGPYRLPTFRQKGVEVGVVRNPLPTFGKPTRITYGGGSGLSILRGKSGANVTQTATAALSMVDPLGQTKLTTEGGNMPVTKSGFETKEVKQFRTQEPVFGAWLDETPYATRVPGLPSGLAFYNEVSVPLSDYFNQKIGIKEALEKMQSTGQRLLDEDHRK